MDLCGTAAAAGAAWTYRGTVYDKDLSEVIADAIRQPGFAMLDIWELCTAYYVPRNRFKKKDLYELIDRCGLGLGLLADKPRPEYSARYREAYEAQKGGKKARPKILPEFSNAVGRQTGVVIAGSAGQKIRSSATQFAQASMFAGLNATQKDDYPITVMTGHSITELNVSPTAIEYTAIESPDYFIVVSDDGLKKTRQRIERLPESCTLYAEDTLDLPATGAKIVRLPFVQTARKVNRLSIGIVALAALLQNTGMFPVSALAKSISTFQKPEVADISLKALEAGIGLVK
jgi:Pyruvate/2-oxoacid:ferredoxin oxidoreductase gamma subunit